MADESPTHQWVSQGEPQAFPWERIQLRVRLVPELQFRMSFPSPVIVVPENVATKIESIHPLDAVYLTRIHEIIEGWRLAGPSPKLGAGGFGGRLEIYAQLDDIWVFAAVQRDDAVGANILTTLHRTLPRKIRNRLGQGYLWIREEGG
jgi:hypothetical protein